MFATAVTGLLAAAVFTLVLLSRRPDQDAVCAEAACNGSARALTEPASVVLPVLVGFGAAAPGVTVALFVDLGSSASRQVFQQVTRAVGGGRLDASVELRLLQLPAGGCPRDSQSLGCLGARAVECAERLSPGTGARAAGAVFDLQWRQAYARGPAEILAAVAGPAGDVEALASCVADDQEVEARLAAHASLAARHGLVAAPGGFVLTTGEPQRVSPFGDWLTEAALRTIVRCLVRGHCEESA